MISLHCSNLLKRKYFTILFYVDLMKMNVYLFFVHSIFLPVYFLKKPILLYSSLIFNFYMFLYYRELNELRKPSSDNPEILRFFKYMKAAKDGQDGQECDVVYSECSTTRSNNDSAPMVSTFNEINKLVQARKF